jgi:hypothetical protein
VLRSGAERTRIRVFRRADGAMVGYAAVHRHPMTVLGRRVTVFRAQAGLLPEYRAHGATFLFCVLELLRYRLRHPLAPVFYLGALVHPSSYLVFVRHFAGVHPRRDCEIPHSTYRLMVAMADGFGVPPVDPSDPLVRRDGWVTRQAKPFWETTADPDVVFFRNRNPGYRQGHGLVVLVPMSLSNLLRALCSHAWASLRQRLSRRRR